MPEPGTTHESSSAQIGYPYHPWDTGPITTTLPLVPGDRPRILSRHFCAAAAWRGEWGICCRPSIEVSLYFDYENSARASSSCICVLLLVGCLRAQTPADSPSVTIRSNVRLVQIDVIAKDKHGNPVSGLEEKDFTVLDDGKPQKIRRISVDHGVEDIKNPTATGDAPKAPG